MKGNFEHASESFKKRNAHLFPVGGLQTRQPESGIVQPLDAGDGGKEKGARRARLGNHQRLTCEFVVFRRREIDSDNNVGSLKFLRDAVCARLGIDDGDKRITWTYNQIISRVRSGVLVLLKLEPWT